MVIHSYRHRVGNAPGELRFKAVEEKLAKRPKIEVPATLLYRSDDFLGGAAPEVKQTERNLFPMLRSRRVIRGAGHFLPREKAEVVAAALLELLGATR